MGIQRDIKRKSGIRIWLLMCLFLGLGAVFWFSKGYILRSLSSGDVPEVDTAEQNRRKALLGLVKRYSEEENYEEAFRLLNMVLLEAPEDQEANQLLRDLSGQKRFQDEEERLGLQEELEKTRREIEKVYGDRKRKKRGEDSDSGELGKVKEPDREDEADEVSKVEEDKDLHNENGKKEAGREFGDEVDRSLSKESLKTEKQDDQREMNLGPGEPIKETLEKGSGDADLVKGRRLEADNPDDPRTQKQAEKLYRKVLARNPKDKKALSALAENLDRQSRLKEAELFYEKALSSGAEDLELYLKRGIVQYRLKQFIKAKNSFMEYIQKGGTSARVYYGLGLAWNQLGQPKNALRSFIGSIEKQKEHAPSYWEAAKLLLDQEKLAESMEMTRSAIRYKPNDHRYLQTLGAVYYKMGRYEKAAESYKSAAELGAPLEAQKRIFYNMGLSYQNMGRYEKAENAFQESISGDNYNPEYFLALAEAQLAGGKPEAAEKTLSLMESRFPGNVDLWLMKGNLRLKAKEYTDALACFQEAYRIAPQDRKIINNLGLAYLYLNQFDQSREFFTKALKDHPENPSLWFNLALLEVNVRNPRAAVDALENTLQYDPSLSRAYELLVLEYLALGKPELAQKTIGRLREKDPDYKTLPELEEKLDSYGR